MKVSTIASALAMATAATAFAPSNTAVRSTARMMSAELDDADSAEPAVMAVESSGAAAAALPAQSASIPFLARPAALDGTMVGDVGFDPLGFAKNKDDLANYREAEIKHGRLAMLAAAGWPLSELFDKKIAAALGMAPVLDASDRVPSLLNGGLGKISPAYWIGCLGAAALVDVLGQLRMKGDGYQPGDYGLRLGYPADEAGRERMQLAELKNGRLAMIAIFGFAVQEFVTKQGVVDETPIFFKPLMQAMHEYANSGYIQ
ncbi:hypothetical protein THAOC_09862 [Thalassiosira oceanica]|uniref:Uncharacterized protein n=1 Tax=Thalassiosira oceanica TaxID=159749 RepID=K0T6G6_THAOC|nr:hypothetical protein THAOC_09862 [Thalassiosira oceanica]|mmetsp:Transcript_34383/g.82207  ORF Transcript_34383/g.82207 Transcript_34383/m.82207 type:complete len:260 (+) Transcript_34383:237-1016(+)|eukprot:EJK68921.1 hypothetical protein THAOC_09862 [Thalassiosira oceanica]